MSYAHPIRSTSVRRCRGLASLGRLSCRAGSTRPANDAPPRRHFLIEGSVGLWKPSPTMSITSESFGIVGSTIDFQQDLGLTNTRFKELHVVFHPGAQAQDPLSVHSARLQPDRHAAAAKSCSMASATTSDCRSSPSSNWQAYRFTYEYDFISTSRGFGGVLLDLKQTHVRASLRSPLPQLDQSTDRSAPVPAIGGIARVYRRAERVDHRRAVGDQGSGEHQLRLQGTLHRARHLRHAELHPQYRCAAGIPRPGHRCGDRQRARGRST